ISSADSMTVSICLQSARVVAPGPGQHRAFCIPRDDSSAGVVQALTRLFDYYCPPVTDRPACSSSPASSARCLPGGTGPAARPAAIPSVGLCHTRAHKGPRHATGWAGGSDGQDRERGQGQHGVPVSSLVIFLVLAALLGLLAATWPARRATWPARRAGRLAVLAAIASQ